LSYIAKLPPMMYYLPLAYPFEPYLSCCEPFPASFWPKHISYLQAKASRATLHCFAGNFWVLLWLLWHVMGCIMVIIRETCLLLLCIPITYFLIPCNKNKKEERKKKKKKAKLVPKRKRKKREKRKKKRNKSVWHVSIVCSR